jgi:hypothetical protein
MSNPPARDQLLAVAAPGPEYLGIEIGRRPVGGDAVSGGNVRFLRRRWRGLLRDLHRRGLDGSRLPVRSRGLSLVLPVRSGGRGLSRARRGRTLLNRVDRLRRDGLSRLRRGDGRCGRGLARTKNLGVEVGGRPLAGDAVHRPVRLVALGRRLSRRRIVRRCTPGNGDCDCGQRGGGPDARQGAVQDVPPVDGSAIKTGYGAGKAKNTAEKCAFDRPEMARGPALSRRTPHCRLSRRVFFTRTGSPLRSKTL